HLRVPNSYSGIHARASLPRLLHRHPFPPRMAARLAQILRLDGRCLSRLDGHFFPAPEQVFAAAALRAATGGVHDRLHPRFLLNSVEHRSLSQVGGWPDAWPVPGFWAVSQSRASATRTTCGLSPATPAASTAAPAADSVPAQ